MKFNPKRSNGSNFISDCELKTCDFRLVIKGLILEWLKTPMNLSFHKEYYIRIHGFDKGYEGIPDFSCKEPIDFIIILFKSIIDIKLLHIILIYNESFVL